MDEIIMQQKDAAKALSGKTFILGVAQIVLCLALAQIAVNLLISLTGIGLFNILFYLYAVWLLVQFMRRTVASYVYTLKHGVLYLEKKLGDSTMSLMEVPLCRVVSMRPVYMAEKLRITYPQVTVIDPASRPSFRMRAAFAVSLLSARLARRLAGKCADEQIGHVIVLIEEGQRHACVFRPNEALCAELEKQLEQVYGFDERMTRNKVNTLYARALERAFPAYYAFVNPLVDPEIMQRALARKQAKKEKKRNKKRKKPIANRTKNGAGGAVRTEKEAAQATGTQKKNDSGTRAG